MNAIFANIAEVDQKMQSGYSAYSVARTSNPWAALAVAVVKQAIKDARRGNRAAQYWLVDSAPEWCSALGLEVDPDWMVDFVERGCRRRSKGKKNGR